MNSPAAEPMPQRRALLAVTALLLLVMAPNLVWLGFPHVGSIWFQALVFPVMLLTTLFALCGRRLWIACLALAPFAPLAPLEAFYIATYRRPTFPEVIGTVLATNLHEATDFLGALLVPLVLLVLAALALALLAVRWSYRARLGWNHRSRYYVLIIVLVTPLFAAVLAGAMAPGTNAEREQKGLKILTTLAAPIYDGFPFGMAVRLTSYYCQWLAVQESVQHLNDFRFHARRLAEGLPGKRQVYVLVIGESSRVDRWQMFGYDRKTTPELVAEPNIVAIPDMVASWPMSVAAIPLLITRKPITASPIEPFREASILRAMQEAGYETWWISNQEPLGKLDSLIAVYAAEAQHSIYLNYAATERTGSYDDVLLRPLREALASSGRDEFIVLHMMGSHALYDMRYPPSFAKFHPTTAEKSSGTPSFLQMPSGNDNNLTFTDPTDFLRMQNSYDNTIAYTDHVLASIIGILRDDGAVSAMWYASDHGENLPSSTCNMWGHGLGTRTDLRVPAFVWYSDAYAAAFPQRLAALRSNAMQPTLSADTFESMVDMAGVDIPGRDPSWSLFNPKWHFRKRVVNSFFQLDFDHSDTDETACDLVIPPKQP